MDIQKLRKDKNLSQIELAAALGVSVNSVIIWERGAGNPNSENLEKLKKVLGVEDGEH